jgi:hypothetical protein
MITVSVTEKHIREGLSGDCFFCAVALAVQEATGDSEASVVDTRYEGLWVLAHGRSTKLPFCPAGQLVWAFDNHETVGGGCLRLKLGPELPPDLQPLTFELPDLDDKEEWQPDCYECGERYPEAELDEEGVCEHCRKKAGAP